MQTILSIVFSLLSFLPLPLHRKSWIIHYIAWKVSVIGVFVVLISPQSDWIWKDTPYLSVFSPNAGKYGPEKLQIRTLSTQYYIIQFSEIFEEDVVS